jgi:hypothetical protein
MFLSLMGVSLMRGRPTFGTWKNFRVSLMGVGVLSSGVFLGGEVGSLMGR